MSARTLSDLLAEHGGGRVEGPGRYVVRCPAHDDSDPSLAVALGDDGRLLLYCRAGCTFEAVREALGLEGVSLSGWVAGAGVEVLEGRSDDPPCDAVLASAARLVDTLAEGRHGGETAAEYALERFGLTEAQQLELRLGYAPEGVAGPWLSAAFRGVPRLVVPFLGFDRKVAGLQGRALDEHPTRWCGLRNPPGASWAKLAVFEADTGLDDVLVTEGPGDALTAYAAGYDAVAIRGAALGGNERLGAELVAGLRGRRVVIAGDNDEAGRIFRHDVGGVLAAAGLDVRALEIPSEAGDLNDWRTEHVAGFADELRAAVSAAKVLEGEPATSTRPTTLRPAPASRAVEADDGRVTADVAVAKDLIEAAGGELRHSAGIGWLEWNGAYWASADATVRHRVHDLGSAYLDAEERAVAAGRDEQAKALRRKAHKAHSVRGIDDILREAAGLPGVAILEAALDAMPHLLPVANGTIDLRTGELRASDPGDLLTAAVPIEYDPAAEAPRWLRFLDESADGKAGFADYLQQLAGYGVTGETSETMFVTFLGRGANGKSVFMDVLGDVFRPVTRVTPFGTFEEQASGGATPELAALRGARLVMASEGAANRYLDEAMIKRVTGGEVIQCRQLYREPMEYRPSFLIILATNHRPGIKGGDEGIWRRVRIVPWSRTVPVAEQDRTLSRSIVEREAAGVLRWAVEGARRWYEQGRRIVEPEFLAHASMTFRDTSDELAGFYPGRYLPTDALDADGEPVSILASEVFRGYLGWCDEEGISRPWSRRALYAALEERGVTRRTTPRKVAYLDGLAEAGGPHDPGTEPIGPGTGRPSDPPSADKSRSGDVKVPYEETNTERNYIEKFRTGVNVATPHPASFEDLPEEGSP